MKISALKATEKSPNFTGFYNNKTVLKGFEKIADHPGTFVAAASFFMAAAVRPLAVSLTPGVDKKNKQYSCANSLTSAVAKFALTEAVALPVEKAIKKIDKNPEKFMKPETIKQLKNGADDIVSSRQYKILTGISKLAPGFVTAIPKAMLTVSLIPVVMNLLFDKNKKSEKFQSLKHFEQKGVFSDFKNDKTKPSFGSGSDLAAKGIGKIFDKKSVLNFVKNHNLKEENIARNMSVATDILLTSSFVTRTRKNDKISEERKKPLICNNVISTGISLVSGCIIDSAIKKNTDKFIKKFSDMHVNNPKLGKYIEGINILRPTMIFAGIYYGILPVISTFLADKTSNDSQIYSKNK